MIKEKRSNLPDQKKKRIKEYQKRYHDNKSEENIIKKEKNTQEIGIKIYLKIKKRKEESVQKIGIIC